MGKKPNFPFENFRIWIKTKSRLKILTRKERPLALQLYYSIPEFFFKFFLLS